MKGVQICFVLFLVACSCFTLTISLSCYICDGQNCTTTTTTATCNAALAQQTINYALLYTTANTTQLNVTSSNYVCVFDYLSTGAYATSNHSYLGCAYSTVNICNFDPKVYQNRYCGLCSTNNCNRNPADRLNSNIVTISVTITLVIVAKILCN